MSNFAVQKLALMWWWTLRDNGVSAYGQWETPPYFAVQQKLFARKHERVTPRRPERTIPSVSPAPSISEGRSLPLSGPAERSEFQKYFVSAAEPYA